MKIKITIDLTPEELKEFLVADHEEKPEEAKEDPSQKEQGEKVTHEDLGKLSDLAIKLNKAMETRKRFKKNLNKIRDDNKSLWAIKPPVRNFREAPIGEDVDLPDTLCEDSPMFAFKHLDATQPYKSAKPKVRRLTKREVDLLVEHMINKIMKGNTVDDESGIVFKFIDL